VSNQGSSGISTAKVGALLGVSADTVRRHWPRWATERGFPHPLFTGGLLRWDAQVVTDWKLRRSQPATPPAVELEPDWAAIARCRGAALDAGGDPDLLFA
jgi:predicted DNA-binding transcriptional regulator AlpA